MVFPKDIDPVSGLNPVPAAENPTSNQKTDVSDDLRVLNTKS